MTQHHELFTNRQLVALTAFSDAIQDVHYLIEKDALNKGFPRQGTKVLRLMLMGYVHT